MFFIRPMLLWSAIVYNMQEVISCTDEYRLVKHLMSSYDPAVRPVINSSEPLEVTFGISLHHIIDLEEKDQLLTTNCWITQMWTDHHLKWNASEFGGISVIRMPFERVWRPDIILYNNADPNYRSAVINTNVIVQNNGEVLWLSHGIYVSVCDINVEHFPFDIQLCTLKWASWTYDGYQLDLKKQFNKGDTSNYQTNGEFDLISFDATRNEQFYSCCPEPYPDITFEIKLKRRPMFYVFNLILPCLLINGIALLVFYVPSESGEKVTLGISALLSMTVFLMTIRDTLPPTEKTPLITLYYGVSTCLVSFSASLSVVTLNISYRGVRGLPVPPLIRRIVLDRLAKLLCFKFETTKYKPADGRLYQLSDETILMKQAAQFSFVKKNSSGKFQHLEGVQGNSRTASRLRDSISECPSIGGSPRFRSKHYHSTIGMTPAGLGDNMCCGCCILRDAVVRHEQRVAASEHTDRACLEWKQVAVVMDRALLTTFILLTVVSTATILLPQTRHFYLDESFQVNATSHQ